MEVAIHVTLGGVKIGQSYQIRMASFSRIHWRVDGNVDKEKSASGSRKSSGLVSTAKPP